VGVPGLANIVALAPCMTVCTFLFRPLSLSTEEYGRLWLASSNDTKQNLALLSEDSDPLRATLGLLRDRLQLHIVDIIGEGRERLEFQNRSPDQRNIHFLINEMS